MDSLMLKLFMGAHQPRQQRFKQPTSW